MTTCPKCSSIWLRALSRWQQDDSDTSTPHWHRNYRCGDCGGKFLIRATWLSQGLTDLASTGKRHDLQNGIVK